MADVPNSSLQQLGQQVQLDPFSQARQMQASRQNMNGQQPNMPAPSMNMDMGGQQQQMLPQLAQANMGSQAGQGQWNFPGMAKMFGVDTTGINGNPQIGKLQLMQRLQDKHGPDYMKQPGMSDFLSAYDTHAKAQEQPSKSDLLGMTTKAQRTLKALLGG